MARVAATASMGIKVGLGGKKGFTQYDSISPHHSFTIERDNLPNELTDEELLEKAQELHSIAEERVKKLMNKELKEVRDMPLIRG